MSISRFFCLCSVSLILACSDQSLKLSNGESKALDAWSGQWLLINYWAIWCKPCVKEVPELNALNDRDDMTVLGVNFEAKLGDALEAEAQQLNMTFANIVSGYEGLFDQERPTVLPATMIIDPSGQFRQWLLGPQTEESILALLKSLEP